MEAVIDNDFLGIEPPNPIGEWSADQKALVGWRFWEAVGQALDGTLKRDIGRERWAEYNEELFRVHQREFFLSGCEALGIADVQPDTKKCVLYHCLSTSLGGSRTRYAIESDDKAWVFYLPPTMSLGAGVDGDEAHMAAFKGWYRNNGPALGNDHLAFVLTHLISRGDPYDAGYFIQSHEPVAPDQRLQFAWGSEPPPLSERYAATFDPEAWPEGRRLKALRNFSYDWAWENIVAAGAHLGEAGVAAVGHAFGLVVNAFLPYFETAVAGTGAQMGAGYYAAVFAIAGVPASVTDADGGACVELGRDPFGASSFELPDALAAQTHGAILGAWARMLAEYGAVVEGATVSDVSFTAVRA